MVYDNVFPWIKSVSATTSPKSQSGIFFRSHFMLEMPQICPDVGLCKGKIYSPNLNFLTYEWRSPWPIVVSQYGINSREPSLGVMSLYLIEVNAEGVCIGDPGF